MVGWGGGGGGWVGGVVIRWGDVVGSDKVGLCGGQCEGGLMWGTVLRWAYVEEQ